MNCQLRLQWVLLTMALLLVVAPTALAQTLDPVEIKEPEMTPALEAGKARFEKHCASCHGVRAAGSDKGPSFLHVVYHPGHHGDRAFILAPKQGVRAHHWPFGDMPPVEGITDEDLAVIIPYIRALQKSNGIY